MYRGGGGAYGPPVTLFTFSHSILTLMFPDQVLNKEFEVGFDIKPSLAGLDHFSALYGNLNDTNLQKKFHKKLDFFASFGHFSSYIDVWYSKLAYMTHGSIYLQFEHFNRPNDQILQILQPFL